jgi:hypothetical protein
MSDLFPDGVRALLPPLRSQEHEPDPMVYVKFYFPAPDGWIWYAYEGEQQGTDFRFFGWVAGWENEFGSFYLSELESISLTIEQISVRSNDVGPFIIHEIDVSVETVTVLRDETFTPMRLSAVKKLHQEDSHE